jgi:hypothetical protein
MVAASATSTIASDEKQALLVIALFWVIAVAIAAFASRIPLELRRKEYGVRRTGRQTPRTTVHKKVLRHDGAEPIAGS